MLHSLKLHLKRLAKLALFRPWGVALGERSLIVRPWILRNRRQIRIGSDTRIGRHVVLNPLVDYGGAPLDGRIVLGDDVYLGGYVQIHAMGLVEIGDGCVLSEHVYVSDIAHGLDPAGPPIMSQPLESRGPVRIGKRVFIGYGCSVLPGVTLGDHCVVGTRSVVTKSFPAYSMIVGSPARLVKTYDPRTRQWAAPVARDAG